MDNTADIDYFKDPLVGKTGEEAFRNRLPSILESHETEINLKANTTYVDDELSTKIDSSEKTTTGEANKIFTFSDEAKTWKDILKIKKSSTEALDVKDDSGTRIMAVDTQNQEIIGSGALKLMPTGFIGYSPVSTVPSGWIKCNGATVSRITYARLFDKIGTTFGAGDGSTTFNLPDLRGEFIRGWDDGRGIDSGRTLGSYQSDELKSHLHSIAANKYGSGTFRSLVYVDDILPSSDYAFKTDSTGGSETRQRNIALMAIIKY